ncbi:MAG: aspartate-semialdehyde dehydrogenase [Bacteroidota bacterium]|nr:aspartate-semialdehyde dehydrogenase [Bacteroidota bacterium]
MKIALVGATGLVGRKMLEIMEEQKLIPDVLILSASKRSVGKQLEFNGQKISVVSLNDAVTQKPDIALFSAGSEISLKYVPKFAKQGCKVIDNSSAWRMHPEHKLIVPEINANSLTENDNIIANPNCSTIQLVMALAPIHRKYGIKRLVISTYQSVSGSGLKATRQLSDEQKGWKADKAYPHVIHENCLPHCDVFETNDYTKEEMKLVNETRKILADETVRITATAVRVPVLGGHSESVNAELKTEFEIDEIKSLMYSAKGIVLEDNPKENIYPMPVNAKGKDEVYVGRLRRDESTDNALNMWIVSDNLRKGAATNAVQIAKYLIKNKLIKE